MKIYSRFLIPLSAALAAAVVVSPAFAWNSSICNPATGEVLKGGGAAPLTTEALYSAYLHNHPGSFELSAGQTCKMTATVVATSTPTATTPPATGPGPVGTPAPIAPNVSPVAPPPVVPPASSAPVSTEAAPPEHDNRPWYCHDESTVGFATPRRSNDLFKDLARPGNTAIGADGLCRMPATHAPLVVATPPSAPAPIRIAGVQIVATPAPATPAPALVTLAPPRTPAPVAAIASVTPGIPTSPAAAAISPEAPAPVIPDFPEFNAPLAGDGSGADVLVP